MGSQFIFLNSLIPTFSTFLHSLIPSLINVKTLEKLKNIKSFKNGFFRNVHRGAGSKLRESYGAFKKLIRNSEYSKSYDFKKFSVQAQSFSFF